jgi:nicotinamidase-related amidase
MTTTDLTIDAKTTALVLVDFQNFSAKMQTKPISPREALANGVRLADASREKGVLVVLIRVGHPANHTPHPNLPIDQAFSGFDYSDNPMELCPDLGPKDGDVIVDKYNWGAFYQTNLDAQLRRRGIKTLIMGGLVTHIGVDSTMRQAQERNYAQILASDAVAAFEISQHEHVLRHVAPRLSKVRTTDQILAALNAS